MAHADRVLAAYERDLADEAELQLLVGELRTARGTVEVDDDTDAQLRRWFSPEG